MQRTQWTNNKDSITLLQRQAQASSVDLNTQPEFDDDLVRLLSSIYIYQSKIADEMGEAQLTAGLEDSHDNQN